MNINGSERSWLKKKFWDKETRYKDVFAQTTTFRINEWLGEDDRQRYLDLYRTNPRRARIVCDGGWGVAEGLVFSNFVVEDFDADTVKQQADYVSYGMDFGLEHDPTTMVSVAISQKSRDIYIFDEMYRFGMTNDAVLKYLRDNHYERSEISADGAEDRLVEWLRRNGIQRIRRSWKPKNSVRTGISFLQNYRIHILPRCKHTIEEFNTYVYKQDKEGNWIDEPVDANNHTIDPIRYALEPFILPRKKTNKRREAAYLKRLGAI